LYESLERTVMTPNAGILQGHEMSDDEISELLTDQGVGVLSMTKDGVPYGIPLSFGYGGGDRLYFLFAGHSEEGRKTIYAERSSRASFLVYETYPDDEWKSVVVEGTLARITIDDWETAREAMADNAYRPDLLTNVEPREDPRVWAVDIAEWSGRKSRSG
jgi:nitroimidazol reductase NimA-like FMN-containing flavoprotein (pyridoxamine 5'-phosphate oxidase superfamily)